MIKDKIVKLIVDNVIYFIIYFITKRSNKIIKKNLFKTSITVYKFIYL